MKRRNLFQLLVRLVITTTAQLSMSGSIIASSVLSEMEPHGSLTIIQNDETKPQSGFESLKENFSKLWPFKYHSFSISDEFRRLPFLEQKYEVGKIKEIKERNMLGIGIKDNYVVFKQRMYSGGKWEPGRGFISTQFKGFFDGRDGFMHA